ncbi:efflux RND transporter periplasmic adaptor subunit [Thaumasiovibrio sp. DFM-14]|uniref:efflux RND transporter periplasmic adaptor subunit n=1 Tax=Thaumasiovibrio sp. DFM-14 TaxID=3384792 RepID=UPI0039A01E32
MKYSKLSIGVVSSLFLFGCGEAQQSQQLPVLNVSAASAELVQYTPNEVYSGRLEAKEDVTISAQVSGYLQSRHFKEGDNVEKGQLLFQLDPAIYNTQVAAAKASLAQAESALNLAQVNAERAKELLPKGSISRSEYDGITATRSQAASQVKVAKASLQAAELNLQYTQITAPISGRISRSSASIGDLIAPSSGPLATLVSIDPIDVQFSISEREVFQYSKSIENPKSSDGGVIALLSFQGEQYSETGKIISVSNRIDRATGTLEMRAEFPNDKGILLPGQYADVTLQMVETVGVITVPRLSVQSDVGGSYVMVVNDDNVVERYGVTMGGDIGTDVIVKGIEEGAQVLTSGLQRVKPGVEVNVQLGEKE